MIQKPILLGKENLSSGHIPTSQSLSFRQLSKNQPHKNQNETSIISQHEGNIDQLNMKILREQLDRIREKYERQREARWEKSKEKEALQNQLAVLQIQIQAIYSQNTKNKSELKECQAKIKGLQREKVSWMEEFYKLNNSTTFNKAKLEAVQKNEQNFKKENEALKKKMEKQKEHNINIYKQIEKLQAKMRQKNSDIHRLKEENANKMMQINKLKKEVQCNNIKRRQRIKSEEDYHRQKQTQLKSSLGSLETHNQHLEQKIQTLLKQIEDKKLQLQKAREYSNDSVKEAEINSFRVRLVVKEKQIQKLNRQVKDLSEKNQILKIQNTILQSKRQQGSIFSPKAFNRFSFVEKQMNKIKSLESENHSLSMNLEAKEEELEKFMQERSDLVKKMEEYNIQYRKHQAEANKRDFQFERVKADMQRKRIQTLRQLDKLKKANSQQKKEIEEKDRIILKYIGK